jgi:RNA polymerase-binding transcription factor DksA
MNQARTEAIIGILEKRKVELEAAVVSCMAMPNKSGMNQATANQMAIAGVETHITKVKAGEEFGDCKNCDGEIHIDQLRVAPFAKLCSPCKDAERKAAEKPVGRRIYSRSAGPNFSVLPHAPRR